MKCWVLLAFLSILGPVSNAATIDCAPGNLQSYIDLQKQRFGTNVIIKTCMENVDDFYEIEPMLLIPFVENAIKHGIAQRKSGGAISIKVEQHNGRLQATVQNPGTLLAQHDGGLGLKTCGNACNCSLAAKPRYTLHNQPTEPY